MLLTISNTEKMDIYESNNRIAVLCKLAYIVDKNGIVSIQTELTKQYISRNWTKLDPVVGREKVLAIMQKSLEF